MLKVYIYNSAKDMCCQYVYMNTYKNAYSNKKSLHQTNTVIFVLHMEIYRFNAQGTG